MKCSKRIDCVDERSDSTGDGYISQEGPYVVDDGFNKVEDVVIAAAAVSAPAVDVWMVEKFRLHSLIMETCGGVVVMSTTTTSYYYFVRNVNDCASTR